MEKIEQTGPDELGFNLYKFMGQESDPIEQDEDMIRFVFNIFPDEPDDEEEIQPDEAITMLDREIENLTLVKNFIQALKEDDRIEISYSFYPRDGDYNIYVEIPLDHPLIEPLK